MKFEREYYVGIKDIGTNNKISNYGMLSILEEIASTQSNIAGFGVNDIETKKKVWLLMDWKLQILERPKYGSTIKVTTWARQISKRPFSTHRDFEVFDGEKKVAFATSKWILFDLETSKITKITDDIINLYKPESEKVFEEDEIEKLKETADLKEHIEYDVKRADIDVNKHMHNLNYLKLAYEALPEKVYYSKEKNKVRIMYKHQILLGDKVKCYYNNQENKDIITIKSQDNSTLHAIVELS